MDELESRPQAEAQVSEETPQETLEALRAERDALRLERDSLNKVVSKGESRKKTEAALLEKYTKQVDAKIEYLASLWDKEHGYEPEPESQSALKGLQRFKAEVEENVEEFSPEVKMAGEVALEICKDNGWDEHSAQYRKATELGPAAGLRYLYAEASKTAAQKAADKAKLDYERSIKDSGGTDTGSGPSAASLELDELRRQYNENPRDPKIAKEWESRRDEFYAMRRKRQR